MLLAPTATLRGALLAALLLLPTAVLADPQASFDVAAFMPPSGWSLAREATSASLTAPASSPERACTVRFYRSETSSGDIGTDFERAWKRLVAGPHHVTERPTVEVAPTDQGWQQLTGTVHVTRQGAPLHLLLTTASGYGRTMAILVVAADATDFVALDELFRSIDLRKPANP